MRFNVETCFTSTVYINFIAIIFMKNTEITKHIWFVNKTPSSFQYISPEKTKIRFQWLKL